MRNENVPVRGFDSEQFKRNASSRGRVRHSVGRRRRCCGTATDLLSRLPILSNPVPRQFAKSGQGRLQNWSRSRFGQRRTRHVNSYSRTIAETTRYWAPLRDDRRRGSRRVSRPVFPSRRLTATRRVGPQRGNSTGGTDTWVNFFVGRARVSVTPLKLEHETAIPFRAPLPIRHGDEDARVRISIQCRVRFLDRRSAFRSTDCPE